MLAERDDDEVMEVWFEEFRTILSRYTIVDLQRVTCRSYFTVATIYARISGITCPCTSVKRRWIPLW